MKILYTLLLTLFATYLQAQVRGLVYNHKEEPLVGCSVVMQNQEGGIVAYGITNKKGEFTIQYHLTSEPITLTARYIGFEKMEQSLTNTTKQPVQLILQPNNKTIEDIVVTYDLAIKQRKDTLVYSVDVLKDSTDVVLADVIKKMPGVDVDASGKIYYQGKEINKFYIENSDLLGKQYNLASDNLPVNDVKNIEVYENHQPIKLLEDKLPTDEAAFNIQLKKKGTKTLTGGAQVGAKPFLWNSKVTPMFFSKQAQAMLVAQSNNVGERFDKYTNAIHIEDIGNFQQGAGSSFGTIRSIQNNALNDERWRDNKSYLVTPNLLFPLGKDFNLRLNHTTSLEKTNYTTKEESNFYIDDVQIKRRQQTDETIDEKKHKTNLLLERNTKKSYIKNAFVAQVSTSNLAQQIQQQALFSQTSNHNLSNFENKFKLLVPLKNEHIIQLKSEVQYQQTENNLELPVASSALLERVFGRNHNELLLQNVNNKLVQTNHSIGRKFMVKTIEVDIESGVQTTNSTLLTNLNQAMLTGELPKNNFSTTVQGAYFYPSFKWRKGIVTLRAQPLISYTKNEITNKTTNAKQGQDVLPFEPSLSILIEPSGKWSMYNYGRIGQRFSSFGKTNIEYFISNAQNVSYGGQLQVDDVRNKSVGTKLKYKNIFSSLFFNGSFNFSQSEQNLLNNILYSADGSRKLETVYLPNKRQANRVSFEFGKLFSSIHLNAKLKFNYNTQNNVVLVNQNQEQVRNNIFNTKVELTENFSEEFVLNLTGKASLYQNKLFGKITNNQQFQVKSKLTYLPTLTQSVGISNELFHNQEITASFLDAYWRKKINNRYRILIKANNILNTEEYSSYTINLNEEFMRTQRLRPRQFLVGVQFRIGKK